MMASLNATAYNCTIVPSSGGRGTSQLLCRQRRNDTSGRNPSMDTPSRTVDRNPGSGTPARHASSVGNDGYITPQSKMKVMSPQSTLKALFTEALSSSKDTTVVAAREAAQSTPLVAAAAARAAIQAAGEVHQGLVRQNMSNHASLFMAAAAGLQLADSSTLQEMGRLLKKGEQLDDESDGRASKKLRTGGNLDGAFADEEEKASDDGDQKPAAVPKKIRKGDALAVVADLNQLPAELSADAHNKEGHHSAGRSLKSAIEVDDSSPAVCGSKTVASSSGSRKTFVKVSFKQSTPKKARVVVKNDPPAQQTKKRTTRSATKSAGK